MIKKFIFILFILFIQVNYVYAIKVLYINGIQNSEDDNQDSVDKLDTILFLSQNHAEKIIFDIEGLWNPIGFDGDTNGPDLKEDLLELFQSKSLEEDYMTYYHGLYASHNSNIKNLNLDQENAKKILDFKDKELDSFKQVIDNGIELLKKDNFNDELIIVTHSQGNLIANYLWINQVSKYGNDTFKKLRVVNVANTSMFSPNNLTFTHEGDAALYHEKTNDVRCKNNSLENLAKYLEKTRDTTWCKKDGLEQGICNFMVYPATFYSTQIGTGFVDGCLHHSIVGTYMSDHDVSEKTQQGIIHGDQGGVSFKDRMEDFIYSAAVSLENANLDLRVIIKLEATPETDRILLKWNEVPNANGYTICMSENEIKNGDQCAENGGKLLTSSNTEIKITEGIKHNTTYYFMVKENNEDLWSEQISTSLIPFVTFILPNGAVLDNYTLSANQGDIIYFSSQSYFGDYIARAGENVSHELWYEVPMTLKRATHRGEHSATLLKIFSVTPFYHKVAGC